LGQAYKEILKHWKAMYEISRYNVSQGIKPWPFMKGFKFRNFTRSMMRDMKLLDAKIG
jgi:hypothetical protein